MILAKFHLSPFSFEKPYLTGSHFGYVTFFEALQSKLCLLILVARSVFFHECVWPFSFSSIQLILQTNFQKDYAHLFITC